MATNKARIVAFAFDNPTYEDKQLAVGAEAKEETQGTATVEIRPATSFEEDRDLEQLIFPDSDRTFKRLKWQFWLIQLLILAHVLVTGYTDPPPDNNSILVQALIVSIQIGLVVVIMMAFFVFTSQTIFIRFGRYDKYLREYGLFYSIAMAQLLMILAVKLYYLVLFAQHTSPLEYYSNATYISIWVVQRCILLAFWVAATYQSIRVFNHRVYDPDHLLAM